MAAFSFNPQSMLGSLTEGITALPIIIGLPSAQARIPNFVLGVTTEEKARTSSTLPGFQISAGDLFLKSARNQGAFQFDLIVSETPNVPSQLFKTVANAVQQLSIIGNAFAAYGGVVPALSALSSNFAVSQINTLMAMKDGFQPILALNLFMPLSAFSTTNPFLSSFWYISDLDFSKGESERGFIVTIHLRELLVKRSPFTTLYNIATNLANELLGPKTGSPIASIL